ncbi:MAG: multicopper oxidase domain-containing protein, partial [Rhodothermales bacterium]|nr:multicopper oxidase domain-containing protein [Rhodothermales bacterium]
MSWLGLILSLAAVLGTGVPRAPCAPGDNYCFRLEPSARVFGAEGRARLIRPAGTPFTVDVDRDGRHRYTVQFELEGLPSPQELGPYSHYVAWVVDPTLDRLRRLAVVDNGVSRTGEIARNKYMLWVSAESDSATTVRTGPLVFRGLSPSSRMEAHGFIGMSAFQPPEPSAEDGWTAPPMVAGVRMMPGMEKTRPSVAPYRLESESEVPATRGRTVSLAHGDTLRLSAGPVSRQVGGATIAGYAFNGQIPGPLIRVDRGSEIVVVVDNHTPEPTSVHWHGLRLENAFDGVPGLTQDPIAPGRSFTYRLRFPDAGLYWYHPHHREDIWQDAGLFGSIRVDADWLPRVDSEHNLVLDDLLLRGEEPVPYGREAANFALMGRFGNVLLTNDEIRWDVAASSGDRIRLFLTNVSNTRTFNWSVDGHALEVVATDVGPFPEPVWTESVVIAPAERYVVDLTVKAPGHYPVTNRVQAIDHGRGRFFSQIDTLGFLRVGAPKGLTPGLPPPPPTEPDAPGHLPARFLETLPELTLDLMLRTEGLPAITEQMMLRDQSFFNPVEWSGTMPH